MIRVARVAGAVLAVYAGLATAGSAQAPVRVLTFNIRYGTANDRDHVWPNRRAHVIATIRDHAPHLLGIQEALRFQLDEIGAAIPGYRELGVGRDDGKTAGEYAALLVDTTRFAIVSNGHFWYSDTPGVPGSKSWGNNVTRICTWARLVDRATNDTIRVYNSHWDHESQPSREKSAALLLDHVGRDGSRADRVIVMADFNAGENNAAFQALLADSRVYLRDTYRAVHPDAKIVGTFHGFEGDSTKDKIDAILTSTNWTVIDATIDRRQFGELWASDHFAVSAVVRANAIVSALPEFVPIQREMFALAGSMVKAYSDFNDDGTLDLFVGLRNDQNRFYVRADSTFYEASPTSNGRSRDATAAAWGNIDRGVFAPIDRWADLALAFPPSERPVVRLYHNTPRNGSMGQFATPSQKWGGLIDVTSTSGLRVEQGDVRQLTWIDFNGDGTLDLFIAFADRSPMLFANNPSDPGHFRDASRDAGLTRLHKSGGAAWLDLDQDGHFDFLLVNSGGEGNVLYKGDGRSFVSVGRGNPFTWPGRDESNPDEGTRRVCVGDVNNDGLFDLFFANYGRNALLLNRGDMRFDDVSEAWNVGARGKFESCSFADFDNDGRIDLFVSGTQGDETAPRARLYRNLGGRFVDATPTNVGELQVVHGAMWTDADGDGDLDLAVSSAGPAGTHSMLRNLLAEQDATKSLFVRVRDFDDVISLPGAEVRVYDAGDTRRLLGSRIVDAGSGTASQSEAPVHFGLPGIEKVDVEVIYPTRGARIIMRVQGVSLSQYRRRPLTVKIPTKPGDR